MVTGEEATETVKLLAGGGTVHTYVATKAATSTITMIKIIN
jgi:hypothetical protein